VTVRPTPSGHQPGGGSPHHALNDAVAIGQHIAGPLIVGMVRWMIDAWRTDRPDAIVFFARDGLVVRSVWQQLAPHDLQQIPCFYLDASRRALRMAACFEVDEPMCQFLDSMGQGLSPSQLLARVGIDAPAPIQCPIDWSSYAPAILAQAAAERHAYRQYLIDTGLIDLKPNHIACVDIGWHGTLQQSLASVLHQPDYHPRLSGWYLGTFPHRMATPNPADTTAGYLLNHGQPADRHRVIANSVELLELLFCPQGLSLVCFQSGADGRPVAVRVPASSSDAALTECVSGMVRGVADYAASIPPPLSVDEIWRLFAPFAESPPRPAARLLGRLQFTRGFGEPARFHALADKGGTLANLVNWPAFYRRFKAALWRAGFWATLTPVERWLLRRLSPIGTRCLTSHPGRSF
jgi:hypothetical protein